MIKNKNIPQWQKSVFDNSVDKTSCVKTKPISTSMIKKIEKDFFDQNYHAIKIKDPELFKEYKKEFGIKNKSKITKKDNTKKINNKENINKIVVRDKADEKLLDTKIIEAKDLMDKNQSSSLNQTNSDDELKEYIEQKVNPSKNPVNFVFHGGSGSSKEDIREAIGYGVIKMNLDTDFHYAFNSGVRDYMINNMDYINSQIGNPDGDDIPNKKYYDPRVWLRKGEEAFKTRLTKAFEDLNNINTL